MAASGGSTRQKDDLVEAAESEDLETATAELMGRNREELQTTTLAAVGEGSNTLPALRTINTPPLSRRYPLHPKSGKRKVVSQSNISKRAAKDPRRKLPTVVKLKDSYTTNSVESSRDKALVRNVARSIVSISSISLDGRVILQCTGIVFGWDETTKCARILTSSDTVCGLDHKPKLLIRLPNRVILEGQLLFFNEHYEIALLEISSESDLPLKLPTFGSNPNYGQEVFVLARGKEANLMARHGKIKWFEEPDDLERNYLMFLDCELPQDGTGGLVIDHDGNVTGMTFDNGGPNATVLAISIILTCIEMWTKFSRIARPIHGLCLRTMELLEVSLQEVVSFDHNINSGYIVDKVSAESTAEKLGIRYGDVIVSFDGLSVHTLPQLENYLLSLGWGFLQKNIESSSTINLKLEVYDLLGGITRSITLPLEFSDASSI